MIDTQPVFIADTCIGGLSVVNSLWNSGHAGHAIFLADYEVNPLGLKSDTTIAGVVERWINLAEDQSQTLVIACNTLSIRYHQLSGQGVANPGINHIVSMVDCFEAMVKTEVDSLIGKKILVIGTEFTATQSLYPEILSRVVPGPCIETVAATELERKIARLEYRQINENDLISSELKNLIENTDIAILACTCFPMVKDKLETLFPEVLFLDPGMYCSGLLKVDEGDQKRKLSVRVTGEVVSLAGVAEFAKSYLGNGSIVSC